MVIAGRQTGFIHRALRLLAGAALVLGVPVTVASGAANDHRHDMQARWTAQAAKRDPLGVSVALDERGTLWLARVSDGHLRVSRSRDHGKTFIDEVIVNPEPENIRAEGQSRPRIAAHNGTILVVWPQALEKVFSGHVRMSRSTDNGRHFSAPHTINDDGNDDASHAFVTLAMDDRNNVAVAWLDGRHRAAARASGEDYAGSSLYYILSTNGGETFSSNLKLADHTCECCRIGLTTGPDGNAVALWRHLFEGGVRDFAIGTLAPGATVRRASVDNWQIDGCPHHGGDIAIDSKGNAHVVWFTGSPQAPGLFYRRVDGTQMTAPMAFGDPEAQAGNATVFANRKKVDVVWREFDGTQYRLLAMHSRDRGMRWSTAREIARTASAADLPLFVANAKTPIIAWNTADGLVILDLEKTR